jgi:hypothetical protein
MRLALAIRPASVWFLASFLRPVTTRIRELLPSAQRFNEYVFRAPTLCAA